MAKDAKEAKSAFLNFSHDFQNSRFSSLNSLCKYVWNSSKATVCIQICLILVHLNCLKIIPDCLTFNFIWDLPLSCKRFSKDLNHIDTVAEVALEGLEDNFQSIELSDVLEESFRWRRRVNLALRLFLLKLNLDLNLNLYLFILQYIYFAYSFIFVLNITLYKTLKTYKLLIFPSLEESLPSER